MAGSSGGTDASGKKKARIEIIPLIDVIFFLLATFVLFTLSLNKSEGLTGVKLPQSETGESARPFDPSRSRSPRQAPSPGTRIFVTSRRVSSTG